MNIGFELAARVTEPGHPLLGAALLVRWPADGVEVTPTVHVRVGLEWVPVQFVEEHLADLPGPRGAA
jgi:hypothetical protein